MNLDLQNRVVLVAGSSRGIGKATAHAFLSEGCRTIITGRDPETLAETLAEFQAKFGIDQIMAFQGDLLQPEVIRMMMVKIGARWGRLNCLVANIGSGRGKSGWDLDETDWEKMFDTNFWSSLRVIEAVLPSMVSEKQGSIVIVTSIVGIESISAPIPYSAAKSALVIYSKNLARLLGPHQVRVNCVAPGNILFAGGSWEKHLAERESEVKRMINTDVPLQRFGRPEEIADLIVFLSSDRSSFITGACVVADGGQTRSL